MLCDKILEESIITTAQRSLLTLKVASPFAPFCLMTTVILANLGTCELLNVNVAKGGLGLAQVSFLIWKIYELVANPGYVLNSV